MVFGHAYTVLGAYDISVLGSHVRLVKCRNPWGIQEWVLDWSDNDPRWKAVSPQDIQRIGFTPNANDGVFFMNYDDFCRWMTKITIAEIHDGSSYVYCTQPANQKSGKYFKVKIFQRGWYSFQLNQTSERLLKEGNVNGFKYKTATINIGQLLEGGNIKWYRGTQSKHRTAFRKLDLLEGEYLVFTDHQFYPSDPCREFTLAISGHSYCEISPADERLTVDFHRKLLLSRGHDLATQISQDVYFIQEVLVEEGLVYVAAYNRSNRPVKVRTKYFAH